MTNPIELFAIVLTNLVLHVFFCTNECNHYKRGIPASSRVTAEAIELEISQGPHVHTLGRFSRCLFEPFELGKQIG